MELIFSSDSTPDGGAIAYGHTYAHGVESGRYKLYFADGVIDRKAVQNGARITVGNNWISRLLDDNKLTLMEL